MAGLAAAVRARELGADVVLHEKGDRPGGSMLLSSCVVWRYREWERFRAECPGGDPEVQRVVWEGLDEALAWLDGLGAPVVARETGNPLTTGVRFDPRGLTDALARRAGELRLGTPLAAVADGAPTILATGGFQGDRELVRRHVTPEADALVLRANPWSSGDGLRLALGRGAALGEPVREGTVAGGIATAEAAGAPVERRDGATRVEVVAGITSTLGGIRVDARGRAADGLWAAGADVGGISTGGWASALASALVLGRVAAEDALCG